MNPTDPQSFFDRWLTAYCDKLHLVRRSSPVDLVQPESPKPPMPVSSESSADTALKPPKPTSA